MRDSTVPGLGRRGLFSIFAFWTSLALVGAGFAVLIAGETDLVVRLRFALFGLLLAWTWACLTPFIFWLAIRFHLGQGNRLRTILVLAVAGVVVAMLVGVISRAMISLGVIPIAQETRDEIRRNIVERSFVPNLMIYIAVAATGLARAAELRSRARQEDAVHLEASNAQLKAQLAEARLAVLRTQLNPHFLFNTLNAVSGLMDEDPRGARRMIARLSELLRYALEGTGEREITVERELELVQRYLEIVAIRYQGRLRVTVTSEPETREALVPNLILQPLAENAMKHGVSRARGHGQIAVHARREGDALILTVTDSGPAGLVDSGLDAVLAEAGMGLGVSHTRQRLAELYGSAQSFELTPGSDGGKVARIVLPFHTGAETRLGADEAGA